MITCVSVNYIGIHRYNYNNNVVVNNLIIELKKQGVKDDIISDILNDKDLQEDYLKRVGIDATFDAASKDNNRVLILISLSILLVIIIYSLIVFSVIMFDRYSTINEIKKLTRYVEEINRKNYRLELVSNKEDELSILQNEIYKTMVMLKESAENSTKDKINLKDSLSDISHQLKTPLTSISIALENIINNPDMDDKTRTGFYHTIQKEINNINNLVLDLLKLSKFDANVIEFHNEEVSVNDLIKESLEKVELIADLKNIEFKINIVKDIKIACDKKWQVEALSNILKNAIEYSNEGSTIEIISRDDNLYQSIKIIDHGKGIASKDIPNIFKRFYKTSSNNSESVGIGLSLAKAIIEKNNGVIKVTSKYDEGTCFHIKYYK